MTTNQQPIVSFPADLADQVWEQEHPKTFVRKPIGELLADLGYGGAL